MDAYGIYKEFGEVLKARKHSKLPDQEVQYEPDGETEIDLSHTTEQKEMLVKNKMAVTAFTMAFRDNSDFGTELKDIRMAEWQDLGDSPGVARRICPHRSDGGS